VDKNILFVYALGLPLSGFFWLVALLAVRQVDEYDDDWKVLRVVGSAGFLPTGRLGRCIFAACGLVAANLFPVLLLAKPYYSPTVPWMLGFLCGQGVCLVALGLYALWLRFHDWVA
jgi:hypothetical protein